MNIHEDSKHCYGHRCYTQIALCLKSWKGKELKPSPAFHNGATHSKALAVSHTIYAAPLSALTLFPPPARPGGAVRLANKRLPRRFYRSYKQRYDAASQGRF